MSFGFRLHNYEDEYKMLVNDTEPEMLPEAHSLGYNGTEGIFCPNAVGVPAQEVHSYNLYARFQAQRILEVWSAHCDIILRTAN